jgi:hypothetical protein
MRAVKKGADVLLDAVDSGEDPVAAFRDHLHKGGGSRGASTPATPKHRTPSLTKRARSAGKTPASGTTPASKRRKADVKAKEELEDDEDSPEIDFEQLDTPTKLKPKVIDMPRVFPNTRLLPKEAFKNPEPGSCRAKKRPVPIAPAQPRPAAQSYNLAPIPGVNSAAQSYNQVSIPGVNPAPAPNVYSNPSEAVGYNYPSPANMANSPAMDMNALNAMGAMNTMRRDSVLSVSSGNDMFNQFDAASPPFSASDANTPQTIASSHSMMVEQQHAGVPTQGSPVIKDEHYVNPQYNHFAGYAPTDNGNDGGNGSVYSGHGSAYNGFDFNNQAQFTGHVQFGDWQQQQHDAQGYEQGYEDEDPGAC